MPFFNRRETRRSMEFVTAAGHAWRWRRSSSYADEVRRESAAACVLTETAHVWASTTLEVRERSTTGARRRRCCSTGSARWSFEYPATYEGRVGSRGRAEEATSSAPAQRAGQDRRAAGLEDDTVGRGGRSRSWRTSSPRTASGSQPDVRGGRGQHDRRERGRGATVTRAGRRVRRRTTDDERRRRRRRGRGVTASARRPGPPARRRPPARAVGVHDPRRPGARLRALHARRRHGGA